jgi:hypothetical protein
MKNGARDTYRWLQLPLLEIKQQAKDILLAYMLTPNVIHGPLTEEQMSKMSGWQVVCYNMALYCASDDLDFATYKYMTDLVMGPPT